MSENMLLFNIDFWWFWPPFCFPSWPKISDLFYFFETSSVASYKYYFFFHSFIKLLSFRLGLNLTFFFSGTYINSLVFGFRALYFSLIFFIKKVPKPLNSIFRPCFNPFSIVSQKIFIILFWAGHFRVLAQSLAF